MRVSSLVIRKTQAHSNFGYVVEFSISRMLCFKVLCVVVASTLLSMTEGFAIRPAVRNLLVGGRRDEKPQPRACYFIQCCHRSRTHARSSVLLPVRVSLSFSPDILVANNAMESGDMEALALFLPPIFWSAMVMLTIVALLFT